MAEDNSRRIAFVVDPREGIGYPATALLTEALNDGWDAHVICDCRAGLEPSDLHGLPKEVIFARVHPVPSSCSRRSARIDAAIALARSLRRGKAAALRELKPRTGPPRHALRTLTVGLRPQLLQLPSARSALDWSTLAARVGARMLVSVGGDELSAAVIDFPEVYRPLWAAADLVCVESDALAALLRQHSSAAARVVVIDPAVDEQLLSTAPRASDWTGPLRILSVGSLSWTHGYEHAIAAVGLLRDRGIECQYRIVGQGAHQDAVVFARHQLGLEGCVELLEPGTPDDLREQMRWAQMLVNFAVVPTSPKAVLDAQAVGVLVLSTEPPDDDADSVLPVPPLQPEALSEALTLLMRDESLRAGLIRAGRLRALRAPSRATQVARFRELHRELVTVV